MKITIYELLDLIKDDKAPKKIKYNELIWRFDDGLKDYEQQGIRLLDILFKRLVTSTALEEKVEIPEEPKKIEKITVREKTLGFSNREWTARNMDKAFAIKINELIDKINNSKEK